MKRVLITLAISSLSNIMFSQTQTYIYNKRSETIMYKDQFGKTKYSNEGTIYGNFKFVFEKHLQNGTPLFTLYNNNIEDQWYSEIKSYGNQEKDGIIYQSFLYFGTTRRDEVIVLYNSSKTKIIMIYKDKYYEYTK